jgi:putative PIN family toxin of toxin-antitoxin system
MNNVVLDVNVLISALITKGKSRELWRKAVVRKFNLILSREILSEFIEVIKRTKFQKHVKERDMRDFLEALTTIAKFVQVKSKFKVIKRDPDDDVILRTAYDGKANYIISGDEHSLSLKDFKGIKIVTVNEMLELVK